MRRHRHRPRSVLIGLAAALAVALFIGVSLPVTVGIAGRPLSNLFTISLAAALIVVAWLALFALMTVHDDDS